MTTESSDLYFEQGYKGLVGTAYYKHLQNAVSTYDKATGFRASSMGLCRRAHLYKLHEFPEADKEPTSNKSLASMRLGTVIGDDIEKMAADMINIISAIDDKKLIAVPQLEMSMQFKHISDAHNGVVHESTLRVVAHPDIVLFKIVANHIVNVHVIDIKSSNPNAFRMVKKDGASRHHMMQVATSMNMFYNAMSFTYLRSQIHLATGIMVTGISLSDPETDITGEVMYISRADGEIASYDVPFAMTLEVDDELVDLGGMWTMKTDPGQDPKTSWNCDYCEFKPGCHFNNHNPFSLPQSAHVNFTRTQHEQT